MTKGREKSDRRTVPEKGGNAPGGRAATASKEAGQLSLFVETADSPRGVDGVARGDRSPRKHRAMPKSTRQESRILPALTMEEVASDGNLRRAFEHVAKNKGAPGPDRESIAMVRSRLHKLVPQVRAALLEGKYQPGMIRRVWIPKEGGQRGLGIPNVIDRWVQEAVRYVLEPHYEPTFHPSSHGFRPGRSCHTAIDAAKGHLAEGYDWVVDFDLEKFFDKIPHQRLIAQLEVRIKDPRLIKLIRRMLKAKVVLPDGVVVSTEEGAPQGGPLSPLLSNIVLDELDQELSRRGYRFVRYADDCNIYVRSERAGKRVMASVTRFIERRLRLKVNQSKSAVARPEERHFGGFRLKHNAESGCVDVYLSARSKRRIDKKIRELTPRNWGQSARSCIQRINVYLEGWVEFFKVCTTDEKRTFAALSAHIRRRLRAILLTQWKRRRTIVKRLIKLGVRPRTAWRQIYHGRRRTWALSHCPAVDRGLNNAHFAALGLVNLPDAWAYRQPRVIADAPEEQLCLALG